MDRRNISFIPDHPNDEYQPQNPTTKSNHKSSRSPDIAARFPLLSSALVTEQASAHHAEYTRKFWGSFAISKYVPYPPRRVASTTCKPPLFSIFNPLQMIQIAIPPLLVPQFGITVPLSVALIAQSVPQSPATCHVVIPG